MFTTSPAVAFQAALNSAETRTKAAPRSVGIDALRAVAILLVIGCHFVIDPAAAGFAAPLAQAWYRVGWAGVDLFFVLSGYLVVGLAMVEFQRTGAFAARRFLVRRAFKIWPPYFAYLAVLAVWVGWQQTRGRADADLTALWPNLLHAQNYFGTPREHTWSLALEEHFYLGVAAVAAIALGLRRRAPLGPLFAWTGAAALLVAAGSRHLEFVQAGRAAMNLYATHLRFDGLLVGGLLAYFVHFRPAALTLARAHPRAALALGALLALPVMAATPDVSPWVAGGGLTAMYLGFGLVVLGVVSLENASPRTAPCTSRVARAFARVGFYSYGIYLWHVDLAQTPMKKAAAWLEPLGPTLTWCVAIGCYVGTAVLVGVVMSKLVEAPALRLRDLFFPEHRSAPRASEPRKSDVPARGLVPARPVPAVGAV